MYAPEAAVAAAVAGGEGGVRGWYEPPLLALEGMEAEIRWAWGNLQAGVHAAGAGWE